MKIKVQDHKFDHLRSLSAAEQLAKKNELAAQGRDIIERAGNVLDDDAERDLATVEEQIQFLRHVAETDARLMNLAMDERNLEAGTPFTANEKRGNTIRDDAMRTLERSVTSKALPAHAAEKVQRLLANPSESNLTARWAIATGNESYRGAFAKLVADPERGHLEWTPDEAQAFREARSVQRAITEGGTGSYLLPLVLDPSILLTTDGSRNPLRQISRVVQTTAASWHGVTSAGVTAEWTPEMQEVADATPTLASPIIPVYKGDAYVQYSFEVGQDAAGDFLGELQTLLVDGADQLMNAAYVTGTGTGQPKGLITSLVAAGGSVIQTGTGTEALASADAFKLQNALGPRFQDRAQFAGHLATINAFRQMETTNGSLKFPSLQDTPPRLLGRLMNEISGMDGTINPAAVENNYSLVYGAFDNFVIVDRIGTTLELIPNIVGTNHRPIGARGALLWFRTGSDVVNPNAFRVLNVTTS
ncbi:MULTISPECIES: phage major capsid protein [Rhodococcus]|uniref:Phage major capsid protein n=1 Tax=Rhodococcus qingshengii JCM 15477 TaxID=1303681 RepID=A0AB38RA27_RHOSG|nr:MULTISPECIES: phage major capsid protein [Rhodococcus]QXC42193.1 phage major capsid protein [Rhodococcus qingshengii]UPU42188.1 phage major capsid protein [Rhodococcus qingshengii JCM 15477]